ncbi:MAG: hypothetical protein JSV19_02685, partial [Phycisphaerales bacterium]
MITRTGLACAILVHLGSEVVAGTTPPGPERRTDAATGMLAAGTAASIDRTSDVAAAVCDTKDPTADRPRVCEPCAGSCFSEHTTPGCDQVDCCEAVCQVMPDCCGVAWGASCVSAAFAICEPEPTGACCFYESCRHFFSETTCVFAGGSFQGFFDCTETTCSGGATTPERASTDAGTIYCEPCAGSCFSEHTTPGCDQVDCCAAVCQVMPDCCTVAWGASCVGAAFAICEPEPTGACCFYESCRHFYSETNCVFAGGSFQG